MNTTGHIPARIPGEVIKLLRHLLPAALLLALTLCAYHPLTWQLGSKTIGGRVDKYIFLWDLWWVRHSLFQSHGSPFTTNVLFYPEGCSLAYHTLCTANGILCRLAGPSANLVLVYNLLLLLSTFLGGFFTFLLLRALCGSVPGALLGSVIFAFSPPMWMAINHGQMNLWSAQWMPLALWCLVRFLRRPDPVRSVLMAFSLAAVFYTGYQQFVFTLMLALMIVPFERGKPPGNTADRRALLRNAAAGLLLVLLLSAPLTVELIRNGKGAMIMPGKDQMRDLSIRPQRFYTQSRNRWWRNWDTGGLLGPLADTLDRLPRRGPLFGYCPTLLVASGWIVLLFRRQIDLPVLYWSLMAVILAWLTLGTAPGLFLLDSLPGLSAIRALYRFCIPLALASGILAAFTCRALITDSPPSGRGTGGGRPRSGAWKPALCVLLALGTWLEYWKAPLHISEPPPLPAPYLVGGAVREAAASAAHDGALIELPYWASGGDFWLGQIRYETLYFQTAHHMPLVGGHHSRLTSDQVPRAIFDPVLVYLAHRRPERFTPPAPHQARETFRRNRIRFATMARDCYTDQGEALIRDLLEIVLDGELLHEDLRFMTFRFDPGHLSPAEPAFPHAVISTAAGGTRKKIKN